MAEAAKTEIIVRNDMLYAAFKRDDFEAAAGLYTEDGVLMPPGGSTVVGRPAIMVAFKETIPPLKTLAAQKLYHFELMNDITAYTNFHVTSTDGDGNIRMTMRDCLIWTKVNGDWFIRRDIFNGVPTEA